MNLLPPCDVDAGESLHLHERGVQRVELVGGEAGDAERDAERLGRDANGVELLEGGDRERRPARALVGLGEDEALALEQPERLADGAAADAELLGDLRL